MIIVLEGTDGAGKTTLANKFVDYAQELGFTTDLWHRGVPERHPLEEYELDLEQAYPSDAEERMRTLLVCDRWHLGQTVYGGLYRDENLLGDGGTWHVDALLQSRGAVQLILAPRLETLRERMRTRGEDYLKEEHVAHVYEAYITLGWRYAKSIYTIRHDFDETDIQLTLSLAQANANRAKKLAPFASYVGPVAPEILLLGEQRGGGGVARDRRREHRAAFVPYSATSGRWLCDTIVRTDLRHRTIGLANVLEDDARALVDALEGPRVVALGQVADAHLDALEIKHGAVPHPQYARRFRHDQYETYAGAIIRAADENEKVEPQWR